MGFRSHEKKPKGNEGNTMTQTYEFKKEQHSRMPVKSFKSGALQVAIWENEKQMPDGQIQRFQTVSFDRRYRDPKSGEWKSTSQLRVNDLPKATLVLQKAYEYLVLSGAEEEGY